MRNRYPGVCYRCGHMVGKGDGHFERHQGDWRTQHALCKREAEQARIEAAISALETLTKKQAG